MGHNAFAFDIDERMVVAARSRLFNFLDEPDHNGELTTQTQKRKEIALEKRGKTFELNKVAAAEKIAEKEIGAKEKSAVTKAKQVEKEAKEKAKEKAKETKTKEAKKAKEAQEVKKAEKAREVKEAKEVPIERVFRIV